MRDAHATDARADVLRQLLHLSPRLDRLTVEGLRRRGLTQARARLLMALTDSGSATGTELSRTLEITPRAVTALVDGLEALGLVRRAEHPSDRRATVIELTARGERTGRDMLFSYRRLADALLGSVSARDLAVAGRMLTTVRDALAVRTAQTKETA